MLAAGGGGIGGNVTFALQNSPFSGTYGYYSGGVGSISPNQYRGNLIRAVLGVPNGSDSAYLQIIVSPDPGQHYINSITVNGVTKTAASASYSYSGGIATWQWTSAPDWPGAAGTYPFSIN